MVSGRHVHYYSLSFAGPIQSLLRADWLLSFSVISPESSEMVSPTSQSLRFLFVFLLGISFVFLSITAFSLSSHFDASPNLELSLELLQLPDSRTAALVIF